MRVVMVVGGRCPAPGVVPGGIDDLVGVEQVHVTRAPGHGQLVGQQAGVVGQAAVQLLATAVQHLHTHHREEAWATERNAGWLLGGGGE